MIQNFEVRKDGESYVILGQAGSNYHEETAVHQASSQMETEEWLLAQGAAQADVKRAMEEIVSAGRVYIEIGDDYSEAEGFPKQGGDGNRG